MADWGAWTGVPWSAAALDCRVSRTARPEIVRAVVENRRHDQEASFEQKREE